jgi:SAM-dependent methyltransferase
MHGDEAISPWIARWAPLVAPGGSVLDVACGLGRHGLYFLKQNHRVTLIDVASAAIDSIAKRLTADERTRAELVIADIENGPWPLPDTRRFDGIVVTHYLWRPLMPRLCESLADGGVLIYETFAVGNETVGKPSRPDFLLHNGELLALCAQAGLRVIAYEDGFLDAPARFVQRVVAVKAAATVHAHQNASQSASIPPPRYPL